MAGLPMQYILETNTTLNLLVQMKNEGKAQTTIEGISKRLRIIAKHANINKPDEVTTFIVNHKCSNSFKHLLTTAYTKYGKFNKIEWQPPHFKPEQHSIKVPTHEKIQMIIANAGKRMALKLSLSLETGMRPVELCNLKAKDIDIQQRLVYPTTAKNGSARTLKISQNLATTLQEHIIRNNLRPEDKIFNITPRTYSKMYRLTRNNLANKLHDPTIKQIRLYDLRHHYATTLYAKTHDLLIVMNQLGHKDIKNTMIYTHLINVENDEYTAKTAKDIKEATALIEDGFEYVTEIDGLKLFRKRK
jgi:integrase